MFKHLKFTQMVPGDQNTPRVSKRVLSNEYFKKVPNIFGSAKNTPDLNENNSSLEFAQSIADIGSWDFDLIGDKVYWSKQMFNILGIVDFASEMVPEFSFIKKFIHPEDLPNYRTTVEEAVLKA